jgi:hypothetical protein
MAKIVITFLIFCLLEEKQRLGSRLSSQDKKQPMHVAIDLIPKMTMSTGTTCADPREWVRILHGRIFAHNAKEQVRFNCDGFSSDQTE